MSSSPAGAALYLLREILSLQLIDYCNKELFTLLVFGKYVFVKKEVTFDYCYWLLAVQALAFVLTLLYGKPKWFFPQQHEQRFQSI